MRTYIFVKGLYEQQMKAIQKILNKYYILSITKNHLRKLKTKKLINGAK